PRLVVPFAQPRTPDIYTLSLHDALPISAYADAALRHDTERQVTGELQSIPQAYDGRVAGAVDATVQLVPAPCLGLRSDVRADARSEEHTSELQSRSDLVCRLLLEKKKSE